MEGFSEHLLNWFDDHGRKHLPWQQNITPYRVWISEIMLQQTQVKTVIPFYEKFMQSFPSIEALASSTEDVVLHHWTGLGYYARARNLHKSAKQIVQNHGSEFPLSVQELEMLPGVGRSTAGAIVAICTDTKATILDGNVKRVLSRYFAIEGWPGTRVTSQSLWIIAERLTPDRRVADYTQAIMDLGATLCTRTSPDCCSCPLASQCIAHRFDQIDAYPGKKPKKIMPIRKTTMYLIENPEGEWLLQRRPSQGLWGGLWSFPEYNQTAFRGVSGNKSAGKDNGDGEGGNEGDGSEASGADAISHALEHLNFNPNGIANYATLADMRHTFTHFHLDITPVHVKLAHTPDLIAEQPIRWYSPQSLDEIGLTSPVTRLLKELR